MVHLYIRDHAWKYPCMAPAALSAGEQASVTGQVGDSIPSAPK